MVNSLVTRLFIHFVYLRLGGTHLDTSFVRAVAYTKEDDYTEILHQGAFLYLAIKSTPKIIHSAR